MDFSAEVIKSFSTMREMFVDRAKFDPMWGNTAIDDITDQELSNLSLKQAFVIPLEGGDRDISEKMETLSLSSPVTATVSPVSTKIFIVYTLHPKFKIPDIRKLITGAKIAPDDLVIIVAADKPTSTNMRTLRGMLQKVQVFELQRLMFNVTHHDLVPLHEIVSDAEISEMLERFNVKAKSQLPHILSGDPVAQYLALKPGQVVRITRSSPSAGVYVMYRLCV